MSSRKKNYKPYYTIDVGDICDFIDDHKKDTKIDTELLKEKSELEAFLKFSLLYFDDGSGLLPYRIKGFENDFCKAQIVNVKGKEIHRSFLSRIMFLCNFDGKTMLCCHPPSVDVVEKVILQKYLRSSFFVDQAVGVLSQLFENHGGDLRSASKDEAINRKEFFKRYLWKAAKSKPEINMSLRDLAKKCENSEQFYRQVFTMILEKIDHPVYFCDFRITRLMALIEHLERVVEYASFSWGKGLSRRHVKSYEFASRMCILNEAATDTMVGRAYSYSRYYENYTDQKLRGHVYLTSHMDSLGLLGLFLEKGDALKEDDWKKIGVHSMIKREKIKRHAGVHEKDIPVALKDMKRWSETKRNLLSKGTLVLDLNFPTEAIREFCFRGERISYEPCLYNIFLVNEIPPPSEELRERILFYAKQEGDAYYPHFRFLMCSRLGMSAHSFDRDFSKLLQSDNELRRHIWLYASKGIETTEHVIYPELIHTVSRLFDRILFRE